MWEHSFEKKKTHNFSGARSLVLSLKKLHSPLEVDLHTFSLDSLVKQQDCKSKTLYEIVISIFKPLKIEFCDQYFWILVFNREKNSLCQPPYKNTTMSKSCSLSVRYESETSLNDHKDLRSDLNISPACLALSEPAVCMSL